MLRQVFLWAALAFCLSVGAVVAQSATGPDYEAWARTATRAEEAIETDRASSVAMQALRAELTDWRTQFVQAQSVNARTILAVEAQIEALGPVPETGSEPDDIAQQRQVLTERLTQLKAPSRTAEIALSRVNVMIKEIDATLSARQAEALLSRGPTPLNPAYWGRGWGALTQSLTNTRNEISSAWNNPSQYSEFQTNLPEIVVLVVFGSLMLIFGRWVMLRISARVTAERVTPARWLWAFVLSLGQILVPLMGLVALIFASSLSGMLGLRTAPLMDEVLNAGLMILVALWLGVRIFPKGEVPHYPMHLPVEKLREGRLVTGLVGLVLGLKGILVEFAAYDSWSETTRAVTYFPLIVLGGVLLWRIGVLLRKHAQASQELTSESDEPARYSERLYSLLGRGLAVLAFVPPILAAVGYLKAAERSLFPMLESLLLLAFVLIVQRVLAELYVLLRRREDVRDGLVPVLTGMALIIIAAPKFALIWGMSETRLSDLWRQAREGFTVGDITLSPGVFLMLIVVFTIGLTLTRLLQGALKNTVLPKTKMDMGARNAFVSGIGYIGIFLAAIIAITSAGIDLTALGYVAGALSVGIGFGLQNIVSNFVSGIILLIERPISEGDWIEVNGTHGTVRDISVRSTRVETFDRTDVIVPNADLISGTVTNFTRGNTIGRVIVPVGVSYTYSSETKRIEAILREIAEAHPMVLLQPPPTVVFQGFGADSLDFEIRAILRDVNWVLSVRSDMNHEIARRFAEEGIEIPFAQRDVWLRNPEALAGTAPQTTTAPEPKTGFGDEPPSESQMLDSEADSEGDGGDK